MNLLCIVPKWNESVAQVDASLLLKKSHLSSETLDSLLPDSESGCCSSSNQLLPSQVLTAFRDLAWAEALHEPRLPERLAEEQRAVLPAIPCPSDESRRPAAACA